MKRLRYTLLPLFFIFAMISANAQPVKFSDDPGRHADLATAQVLIAEGCRSKLNFRGRSSAIPLTPVENKKLQTCMDDTSTDLAFNVQSSFEKGLIDKERLTLQTVHEALLFAKKWSPTLAEMPTEAIVTKAKAAARMQYPFPKH